MPHRLPVLLAVLVLPLAGTIAAAQEACPLTSIGSAEVAGVRDGRTLMLRDGRELRLAAVETADGSDEALRRLVDGRVLRLAKLGTERDRYGRLVAFAFAGDEAQSLQQVMLARGEARVTARVGDKPCADALLRTENQARSQRRGLWADPNFAPLAAQNNRRLTKERGHFALVEGTVLSVRLSGGTLYMNFARRWSEGFSVAVPRRRVKAFAAAGLDLERLQGRRVRVRGWLERRRGPIIAADAPEQIELIDGSKGGT